MFGGVPAKLEFDKLLARRADLIQHSIIEFESYSGEPPEARAMRLQEFSEEELVESHRLALPSYVYRELLQRRCGDEAGEAWPEIRAGLPIDSEAPELRELWARI